jgi:ketosteroid isomerase-like protein
MGAMELRAQPASAPAPMPSVTLPADLARVLTDYEKGWQSKDAAGLASLFAEDGFVLPNGAPPVRGRSEIARHYAGQGGPLALRALAFATEGAVGYIIGGYARQAGEPDTGKFTLTLRRAPEGRWLIMSDMDNGNARPRPAASARVWQREKWVPVVRDRTDDRIVSSLPEWADWAEENCAR